MSEKGVSQGLKVGIIGGSIAGCAVAIELGRAGCDVTIFERSTGSLQDRGAGIGFPFALVEELQRRDVFDADMAIVPVRKRQFVVLSQSRGRLLWEQRFALAATNWDVLYRTLRKRVSDDIYYQGYEVTALHGSADGTLVEIADGQDAVFDLVACADGYTSTGRRILFPNQALRYAGYVMWRGLLDERLVNDITPFEGVNTFAVTSLGHLISYLVPGRDGETQRGKRRLNWGWYVNTPEADLAKSLTDRNGTVHTTSLAAGSVPNERVKELHDLAARLLPEYIAEVIARTRRPFIQAIFDGRVPSYRRGHICLIGDASAVARPHVAAGATKALYSALALADSLKTHPSLDTALALWDDEQRLKGDQLVSLAQRMGEALQDATRDWASMDEEDMSRWWDNVIGDQRWYATAEAD